MLERWAEECLRFVRLLAARLGKWKVERMCPMNRLNRNWARAAKRRGASRGRSVRERQRGRRERVGVWRERQVLQDPSLNVTSFNATTLSPPPVVPSHSGPLAPLTTAAITKAVHTSSIFSPKPLRLFTLAPHPS